jgi:hypothetical protein
LAKPSTLLLPGQRRISCTDAGVMLFSLKL